MNTTPRTDAQCSPVTEPLTGWVSYPDPKEIVPADFARELERELNEARDLHANAIHLLNEETLWRDKLHLALSAYVNADDWTKQLENQAISALANKVDNTSGSP